MDREGLRGARPVYHYHCPPVRAPLTTFRCRLPPLLIVKCTPPMPPTIVVPRRPLFGLGRRRSGATRRIIVLPSAPPRPSVDTSHTLPPLLIVKRPSILTSSSHLTPPLFCLYPHIAPYCACHTIHDKTLCGVVRSDHQPHGLRPNRAQAPSPMVCG